MNWNAPAGAASYHVYRALHTNGFYNPLVVVTTPGHVDQAVAHGGTYHYVVVAANAGGSSGDSAVISATVNGNRPGSHTFINVNFGAHLNVNGADEEIGMAATGQSTNDYWNVYSRDVNNMFDWRANGAMTGLKDADGAVTGVGLAVTNAAGFWVASLPDPMYNSYLYASGGGNVTVVVTNLPAGEYDLYLYGHGNANEQNSVFDVTIGGTSSGTLYGTQSTTTTTGWNSVNWEEGQQYVVFRGLAVTGAGQSLRITVRSGNSPFTPINGLQIKWATPASAYADGIPVAWREQHFGTNFLANPHALATADPDGDGANNYQEFVNGTHPLDVASVKRVPISVSTYAGSVMGGGDGFRIQATFNSPNGGLIFDAVGNLWIPESVGNRIRKMNTDGLVTTVAGDGVAGSRDGNGTGARFNTPNQVAIDAFGNAYVNDFNNHRIRKIDLSGNVTTFAGSTAGFQDGIGTSAQFNAPQSIAAGPDGNLYVADRENHRIRKITPTGEVTTYAGGAAGFNDGDRNAAQFNMPVFLDIDAQGVMYVADWGNARVRKIDFLGTVSTVMGTMSYVEAVRADGRGGFYVKRGGSPNRLMRLDASGRLDWLLEYASGFQDGPIDQARFSPAVGGFLHLSATDLLVSDVLNNRLRLITLSVPPLLTVSPESPLFTNFVNVSLSTAVTNGVLRYTLDGSEPTTIAPAYAGSFTLTAAATVKARVFVNGTPVSDVLTQAFARVYALDDGIPANWREQYFGTIFLANPQALATADPDGDGANNYQEFLAGTDPLDPASVRKVPLSVSTFAGSVAGGQDGFRTNATFNSPGTLTFDPSGRIWVCELTINDYVTPVSGAHRIRIIDTIGNVTTFGGSVEFGTVDGPLAVARFAGPTALDFDKAGNVLVLERSNHRIRSIDTNGIVSTLAGSTPGYQDGTGSDAKFNMPMGMCIDKEDNLYVADFGNACVRKVAPQGVVSTYAGGSRGYADGDRSVAQFDSPSDISIGPEGTLYVADWVSGLVRKIDTNGVVSTFASGLLYIERVFADAQGNVYASVGSDGSYRKFRSDGSLDWSIRNPSGFQDGPISVARFGHFGETLVLSDGNLLISDGQNNRIRVITLQIPPLLTVSPSASLFTNFVNVSLTSIITNGVLRYTLDGSEPTSTAPAYAGSFTLTAAATIKARVFVNGNPVSDVLTQTFARVYALDDGIPASWREQYFGTNYLTDSHALATADPDGDGANNYQEFVGGTNPLDPASVKKVPLWVSTFAGSVAGGQDGFRAQATFNVPTGVAFDATGNVWIPEAGHRIRRMDINGMVTTVAGDGVAGSQDGEGTVARFNYPNHIAFDTSGNAYVIEFHGHRIRKIDLSGNVTTFAGSTVGFQDGTGTAARFSSPQSIATGPDGYLYVADTGNHRIRKVSLAGAVTTYAGGTAGLQDGDRAVAQFSTPVWATVDGQGNVYVADWGNARIRKIGTNGVVSTVASGLSYVEIVHLDGRGGFYVTRGGPPYRIMRFDQNWQVDWKVEYPSGFQDGTMEQARFSKDVAGFLHLSATELLVSDVFNHRLRLITLGVPPLLTVSPAIPLFTNLISVSLSTTVTNGVLRYTLDGSEPTATAPAYAGSFTLTAAAATVKAAVFVNNIPVSGVLTQAFARVYALNDGIPASWREQFFGAGYLTDPRVAWDADPDGDGANNLQEYVAGTNPLDPLSGFRVGIRMAPVVTWNSISNRSYRILRKDTLSATNWSVVVPSVLATNSVSTFIDVNASSPYGFYVIEVLP